VYVGMGSRWARFRCAVAGGSRLGAICNGQFSYGRQGLDIGSR
jgi:hypothetical protein